MKAKLEASKHFIYNSYPGNLYILLLALSLFSVLIMSNWSFADDSSNQEELSALERRIRSERETYDNNFSITPHRPSYVLPITYNSSPNSGPYEQLDENLNDLDNVEIKYQISFKVLLARELIADNGYLFAAYTQQSFWQAYNSRNSSPFRETNYEPELFVSFLTEREVLGFKNRVISFGINHQSNGRMEPLSRSWNRLFMNFVFERDNLVLYIKPWYRIPEDKEDDDNPDIEDYIGHGEIGGAYYLNKHVLSFMVRNNLQSDNYGAVQLDWSFPLGNRVNGYIQYFYGYGESLVDYDHKAQRIGLGIILANWI